MELNIEEASTKNPHRRYSLPAGTPDRWNVYLDTPTTWGLATLHDRTWKSVGAIVAQAIRHELSLNGIDTGMNPPPQTWRSRLAYWLIRREKRLADKRRERRRRG